MASAAAALPQQCLNVWPGRCHSCSCPCPPFTPSPALHTPTCSAPTIDGVVVSTVDLSVATAAVIGPTLAPSGGWTGGYNLSVCAVNPLGSCTFQACTPVKLSALTSCTLTGLNQNTTYRVRAWAVQGSITSQKSNASYFRTKLQE